MLNCGMNFFNTLYKSDAKDDFRSYVNHKRVCLIVPGYIFQLRLEINWASLWENRS